MNSKDKKECMIDDIIVIVAEECNDDDVMMRSWGKAMPLLLCMCLSICQQKKELFQTG